MKKENILKMNDLKDKQLVVKSNKLIEASYRLTVQEQRIILLIASMLKQTDEDFETYRIDVKDFMELIGVKGHSKYEETKNITKKLKQRVIVIKDVENNTELQINWVSSFKYFNQKGYVQIRFDPELKPYLLQLKERFTKYDLRNVMPLRSNHSIRMYELLKQYEKMEQREFDLDDFRKVLGFNTDEYKQYGHLKNRILNVAKKELAEKTDIYFEYQELKKGRKVEKIKFYIYSNKGDKVKPKVRMPKQLPPSDVENRELYNRLIEYFLLSPSQTTEILRKFDEKRVIANLDYVENKYKEGEIKNLGAYTLKAIEDNYHVQTSLFDLEKQQKKLAEKRQKIRETTERELEKEYEDKINSFQASLSEKELKKLEEKAQKEIDSDPKIKNLKQFNGDRLFLRVILKRLLVQAAGLPNFEDWKQEKLKNHPMLKNDPPLLGKNVDKTS